MAASTIVVTGWGRLVWPSLWEMTTAGVGKPCYEITLLFPHDSPDIRAIQAECEKAAAATFKDLDWRSLKHWPVKDGDVEKPKYSNFKGQSYVRFKSYNRPAVKDSAGNILFERNDDIIYPGACARVAYTPFAYETRDPKGSVIARGVSCWMTAVQKGADAERWGIAADLDELLPPVADNELELMQDLLS